MLSADRSPMFSPKNPANAEKLQLTEEYKCTLITSLLTAKMEIDELNREEARKQAAALQPPLPPIDMNDPNVITVKGFWIQEPSSLYYAKLIEFDRLLVLRTRKEAIEFGEAAVKTIREFIPEGTEDVVVETAYQEFQKAFLNTETNTDEFSGIILLAGASKSFMLMREILKKLTPELMANAAVKDALEGVLFRAMHFGDADAFNHLLDTGVNPHYINTGDFLGGYRPLNLLMFDMERCIQKTQHLMKDAQSGESVKYGTMDELKVFLARRIHAYKTMVTSLLAHGADPDDVKVYGGLAGVKSARETVAAMLERLEESLGIKDGVATDYQLVNKAHAASVMEMILNAPKLENVDALEGEAKRMRV